MTCAKCTKPCPEHGITFCVTCHKHDGECSIGDCVEPAAVKFAFKSLGGYRVAEVRAMCEHHATDPAWEFARAGGEVI